MKEDENKKKTQIQRKLNIVTKLLNEQRRIELDREKILKKKQEKRTKKNQKLEEELSQICHESALIKTLESKTSTYIISCSNDTELSSINEDIRTSSESYLLKSSKTVKNTEESEIRRLHVIPSPRGEVSSSKHVSEKTKKEVGRHSYWLGKN